jgi:hypothetical protein
MTANRANHDRTKRRWPTLVALGFGYFVDNAGSLLCLFLRLLLVLSS